MGNQQERQHLKKIETQYLYGWLAGMIDSDGCLQLALQRYRKKKFHYRPQIVFHGTNIAMMETIQSILKTKKIGHYVQDRFYSAPEKGGKKVRRPYRRITIYGFKRCLAFFEKMGIQLIGKARQQKIMLDYIRYRLSLKRGSPVTEKDTEFYLKMKKANSLSKGAVSPETIRRKGSRVVENYHP